MAKENTHNPFTNKLQKIVSEKNFFFDATVGDGGDYPATNGIKLAIADQKYNLKITSNLIENQNWGDLTGKVLNLIAKEDFTITLNSNKIAQNGSIYAKNLNFFDNCLDYSGANYQFDESYLFLDNSKITGSDKRNSFLRNGTIDGTNVIISTGNDAFRLDSISNVKSLTYNIQNAGGVNFRLRNGNIGLFILDFKVNYTSEHSIMFLYNMIIQKFTVINSQINGLMNIFEKTQFLSGTGITPTFAVQTDYFVAKNLKISKLTFDDYSPYYSGTMENYNVENCEIFDINHRISSPHSYKNGIGYLGRFEHNKIYTDLYVWGDEITVKYNYVYGKIEITNEADRGIIDGNRTENGIFDFGSNTEIGITNTTL